MTKADTAAAILSRQTSCLATALNDTAKITACNDAFAKETAALAGSGSVVVNMALLVGGILATLGMAKAA